MRLPRIGAAFAALSLLASVSAHAELMIAPTRILLQPSQRTAELVLVNKGKETAAFRIAVENRRMKRDGALEAAPDAQPGELFAADKIRFSPRQLVLEPGARQTIRISADLPQGLPDGEYRSHLRLMSAPTGAPRDADLAKPGDDRTLSIQLIAIRSLTIPIIVRVGKLGAEVKVDGANFAGDTPDLLVVHLARSGASSTYGDIKLTVQGEPVPAWQVRGVAVYTPNIDRDVLLPLPKEVRAKLAGKQVRIDYVSADEAAPGVLASTRVQL